MVYNLNAPEQVIQEVDSFLMGYSIDSDEPEAKIGEESQAFPLYMNKDPHEIKLA